MRMSKVHVSALRALIEPILTDEIKNAYRQGKFPGVKDIDRRFRWDAFYAVKGWSVIGDNSGYTDAHIDTALRAIVPSLRSVDQ